MLKLRRPGLERVHVVKIRPEFLMIKITPGQLNLSRLEDIHFILEILLTHSLLQTSEVEENISGGAELEIL